MDYTPSSSSPVVWRQYHDPAPTEPRVSYHHEDFADKVGALAREGALPAIVGLAVIGIVLLPVPLAIIVAALGGGWQAMVIAWFSLMMVGVMFVCLLWYNEGQYWLGMYGDRVQAMTGYVAAKTPVRVQANPSAPPVIVAQRVEPTYGIEDKKVIRLAYWVRRAVENHGNRDGKPGPRLMRHDLGEYSVIIPETGEEVTQKIQQADYAELVNVMGLLVLERGHYQIADPKWTMEQATEKLIEALKPHATRS